MLFKAYGLNTIPKYLYRVYMNALQRTTVTTLALCNSRRRNHVVWPHREEEPRHCSISIASLCPNTIES